MNEKVLLVIPCFNEEKRIPIDKFKAAPASLSFLFVDDGSIDGTYQFIKGSLDSRMHILKLEKNFGKAEAVRQGILFANKQPGLSSFYWIGYWDADLSTPLYEVENFIHFNKAFYGDLPVVFGSRVYRFGSDIKRYLYRHLLGRFFATVVSSVFKINSYDSQCGAKLFKKEIIDRCFSEKFVSKWIFDVEIILRMKNRDIVEYPLKEWRDVSGGQLNVLKVAVRVMLDIISMKKKYREG